MLLNPTPAPPGDAELIAVAAMPVGVTGDYPTHLLSCWDVHPNALGRVSSSL